MNAFYDEIMEELKTALSVCQCAEDSATEERIKQALGFVNGTLCTVKTLLDGVTA